MTSDAALVATGLADKPNRVDQVYEQIIDILIGGELRPGDVIVERKMADRLNASRTPVREALGRLEAERMVLRQPGRGVTVAPFSTEAFVEVLNIRQLLEAEAARLAAGHVPLAMIAEIRAAVQALSQKKDPSPSEIWAVDDLLHGAISEAAGNETMAGMIRDLRRRTHVFNTFRNPNSFFYRDDHSGTILDALETGDGAAAQAAMFTHIDTVKIAIVNRLAGVR
ncbi:GntR family transcriptional regulator [Roseisalinus antarcticus]|uniref:HTH-type transcriptional regulator LutR n=1 Tax=Roseisalinus antarcticus TaxID=254357 RepID=A0A1Y5T8H6_9RHOB|nr:GntR family transcriptional regulator [Roseisalinus antarcticus]SLN56380.1 HTH-type transcriptional regulator LutR [Roseisalinus antarcticus]